VVPDNAEKRRKLVHHRSGEVFGGIFFVAMKIGWRLRRRGLVVVLCAVGVFLSGGIVFVENLCYIWSVRRGGGL
jgi:hypothetical protein